MTGAQAAPLRATYRLQLSGAFGFEAARRLIPYLRDLGVSHLYLSPSLQARPGSTHGYDVIDPSALSSDLGGSDGFQRLAGEARGAGLGVVLDVVPNHMAADDGNRFWRDRRLREQFFDIDPVSGRWRRFFDIDDLAGVRQEDPEVFEATHGYVLGLVRDGLVDGLRVDHPDGLADPAGYLSALRERGASRVWVEKILDPNEQLREWPVCGTVGYEFLNDVCALFVDPAGKPALTTLWKSVSGDRRSFGEWALEAKLEQASGTFTAELERLARLVPGISVEQLAQAVSSLPVYRTYVDPARGLVAEEDRLAIGESGMERSIASRLLLQRDAPAEFVIRFQQTTPAIMAKGVEDTAFYRYGRLLALNDVGGDPSRFGLAVEDFHAGNLIRGLRFPEALLTTMTHDAKRSADVRARIGALSMVASEWAAAVEEWMAVSDRLRSFIGGSAAPDDVERYFIFQTLIGAWPIDPARLEEYLEKALREAKRNTSWVEQDHDWEQAVTRFASALVADEGFMSSFEPFTARVAALGRRAALGYVVLKLTSPGVPDIYQGDELEFRALVDPDNRRPVDWDMREAQLRRLMGGGHLGEEGHKLWVISRLLGLRARRPEPFAGAYEPVDAGEDACAFVRGGDVLSVVALRGEGDDPVEGLPGGRWSDVLSGHQRSFDRRTAVRDLVGPHGFAVYERL